MSFKEMILKIPMAGDYLEWRVDKHLKFLDRELES
jgi:hypothetical protein